MQKWLSMTSPNTGALVISFGMQQQMIVPNLIHSQMYSQNQLVVCNLCLHRETTGTTVHSTVI